MHHPDLARKLLIGDSGACSITTKYVNGIHFLVIKAFSALIGANRSSTVYCSRHTYAPELTGRCTCTRGPMTTTSKTNTSSDNSHVKKRFRTDRDAIDRKRLPLAVKVFGVLCLVAGGATAALLTITIVSMVLQFTSGNLDIKASTATVTIYIIEMVLYTALAAMFATFGIRLLRNKRKHAAQGTEAMIFILAAIIVCSIMLNGLGANVIPHAVVAVFLIVMQSYLDPALAGERELRRKLRDMETREQAEEGTLGLDPTGKGYITLNFFNLFWIFVVCSVLGLIIETIYHVLVVEPGVYQDRAGLLFGPFSPIYGVGAMLMTMALNRFHKAPLIVVFLVSAVIGGAFEFAVSWFMQFAFGIVAWDYTGTFLSIDGRTNGMFMAMWGVLGMFWVKLCLPWMLKLVNRIPWNWRYSLTAICAAIMIVDCAMTLMSLDRWYQREAGIQPDNAISQFIDDHFDNDYMAERFQSMSIDPNNATRTM